MALRVAVAFGVMAAVAMAVSVCDGLQALDRARLLMLSISLAVVAIRLHLESPPTPATRYEDSDLNTRPIPPPDKF